MKFQKRIFLITLISCILASCSTCKKVENREAPEVYIGIQSSSPEERDFAWEFLNKIYREIDSEDYVHIDFIKKSGLEVRFSDQNLTKRQVVEILNVIEIQEFGSEVLPEVFERIKNLAKNNKGERKLYAYIIAPSTSNSLILNKIKEVVDRIASHEDINLDKIEVHLFSSNANAAENRLLMSNAMSTINSKVSNTEE